LRSTGSRSVHQRRVTPSSDGCPSVGRPCPAPAGKQPGGSPAASSTFRDTVRADDPERASPRYATKTHDPRTTACTSTGRSTTRLCDGRLRLRRRGRTALADLPAPCTLVHDVQVRPTDDGWAPIPRRRYRSWRRWRAPLCLSHGPYCSSGLPERTRSPPDAGRRTAHVPTPPPTPGARQLGRRLKLLNQRAKAHQVRCKRRYENSGRASGQPRKGRCWATIWRCL